MKKLMFLLAAASLSSVAFAQQKSNSQNVLVGESVDVMEVPVDKYKVCLLYTSPSPRDGLLSRMPSSA